MAAELAFIERISTHAPLANLLGGTGDNARVWPNSRPQKTPLPAVVVRGESTDPSDTKSGTSTLDTETVQVLIYAKTLKEAVTIEKLLRPRVDRIPEGTYNGESIQSSRFMDRDSFTEDIESSDKMIDKPVNVIEHIYQVRVRL
jgi:hypothetical protein